MRFFFSELRRCELYNKLYFNKNFQTLMTPAPKDPNKSLLPDLGLNIDAVYA